MKKNIIINSANNQYNRIEIPYYFRWPDSTVIHPRAVAICDFSTDEVLEIFINVKDASNKTKISDRTISNQCLHGKPKTLFKKANNKYFKFINYN